MGSSAHADERRFADRSEGVLRSVLADSKEMRLDHSDES